MNPNAITLDEARYQLTIREDAVKPCDPMTATDSAQKLIDAYAPLKLAESGVFHGLLTKLLCNYPYEVVRAVWMQLPLLVPKAKFDLAAVKSWCEREMETPRQKLAEAQAMANEAEQRAKAKRDEAANAEFAAWFRWWRETNPHAPSLRAMSEHYAQIDEAERFPPWVLRQCPKPDYAP